MEVPAHFIEAHRFASMPMEARGSSGNRAELYQTSHYRLTPPAALTRSTQVVEGTYIFSIARLLSTNGWQHGPTADSTVQHPSPPTQCRRSCSL